MVDLELSLPGRYGEMNNSTYFIHCLQAAPAGGPSTMSLFLPTTLLRIQVG
jgi:hypothetical protein